MSNLVVFVLHVAPHDGGWFNRPNFEQHPEDQPGASCYASVTCLRCMWSGLQIKPGALMGAQPDVIETGGYCAHTLVAVRVHDCDARQV